MTTNIDLTNNALLLIGANEITSFDTAVDTSREARISSRLYENNYHLLLSMAIWHFAKAKTALTADAEAPLNEFNSQFTLPDDTVKLVNIYTGGSHYTISEEQIFSNQSGEIEIDYIFRVDEDNLPKWFQAMFEFYWASILALPVTRKAEISAEMDKQFKERLTSVMVTNAEQVPTESFGNNPFVESRFVSSFDGQS